MNAILIGTLTGTSNNRIEVFTRKIIIHYPKAPKKIIAAVHVYIHLRWYGKGCNLPC